MASGSQSGQSGFHIITPPLQVRPLLGSEIRHGVSFFQLPHILLLNLWRGIFELERKGGERGSHVNQASKEISAKKKKGIFKLFWFINLYDI